MTLKMKNKIFDILIDKGFVTTEELVNIGITESEIVNLCELKVISLKEDGNYTLGKVQGLLLHSYSFYKKNDMERYKQAVLACLRFYPNNCAAATLLFSDAIIENDFNKALEYFEIMDKSVNKNNIKDHNFWLLLLSYIIELPEQYMDRLSNLRVDDILINNGDIRYSDSDSLNIIRKLVFEGNFDKALELIESIGEASNDKAYNKITRNLLTLAKENYHVEDGLDEIYYDLVVNGEYTKLVEMLEEVQGKRRLTFGEFCLYTLSKNITNMIESGRVPKAKDCKDINFVEAIVKHNYELALQINRCSTVGENCSNDEAVSLMLQKIIEKRDEIKFQRMAKQIGSNEFAKFYNDLMNNDIDNALLKLNTYLAKMNKSEYYSYIFSLIKLSLVEEDRAYVVPMLALSSMNKDDFYFDVSTYLQDYYFAFMNKDYKRAIVYLNILSSAKDIGGVVAIDTTEMEKALFNAIHEADINELDIVIEMPKKKNAQGKMIVTEEAVTGDKVSSPDEEIEVPAVEEKAEVVVKEKSSEEKVFDELAVKYSSVVDVVHQVVDGDNFVLLEPVGKEDTDNILYLVSCIPDLEVSLVDSIDGSDKHVMLRYSGGSFDNYSGGDLIRAGNSAYYEKRYEDCIEYFEKFVAGRGTPKSFIYARLGLAYRALGTNEGYKKAIECLTIATSRSNAYYDGDFDFTRMVSDLKAICGYNGVKVLDDKNGGALENGVQYKKTDKK